MLVSIIFYKRQELAIITRVRDHNLTILHCRRCFMMMILFPSGERDDDKKAAMWAQIHPCCTTNSFP